MANKYLDRVVSQPAFLEKTAILAEGLIGLGVHAAQNLAAKLALKTPAAARVVADATRQGFLHGKNYDAPLGLRAAAGIAGKEFVEVPHLANKAAQGFRQHLIDKGHEVTKTDHLALRMATQGRLADLERLSRRTGGKSQEILGHFHDYAKNNSPVAEMVSKAVKSEATKPVETLFQKSTSIPSRFKSTDHPLLNNISYNVTRGKEMPVVSRSKTETALRNSVEPLVTAGLSVVEPIGGAINYAKQGLASHTAQNFKPVKQVSDWLNRSFTNSARQSAVAGAKETGGGTIDKAISFAKQHGKLPEKLKENYSKALNFAKGTVGNGVAGELDRTSHALGRAIGESVNPASR